MSKKEPIILPPKYYLDYFRYLIQFVEEKSESLLGAYGGGFIEEFGHLSEDAQCLMLRMANRKGEYFRLSKFQYEEIENIGQATEELIESDFISLDPPHDPLLFRLFTKGELKKALPDWEVDKWKKDELLLQFELEAGPHEYERIQAIDTIIHFLRQDNVNFLKMLFFGHPHGMMTEFVIRDVGNIKLENLEGHDFKPWFESHEEAWAVFQLNKINREIKLLIRAEMTEDLLSFIAPINWSNFLNFTNARKPGDKLMLTLGEYFEKRGFLEDALSYYALARKHPCRERQVRIYDKLGREEEAIDLASYMAEEPFNATESIFAKDFLAKSSKRNYRSTTARIKLGDEVVIPKQDAYRVEELALLHFSELGYEGVHTENFLWRSVFGLMFWDELFDIETAVFHHPLQRAPSDLYSSDFFASKKEQLKKKLNSFRSKKQILNHLMSIYESKEGINNRLVSWHESLPLIISEAVSKLPTIGLKKVLLEMAKNVRDNSTGFPDLFIWNDNDYHFYEIKSPNDHLSAQQLYWLDFFKANKIKSEILRVKYE